MAGLPVRRPPGAPTASFPLTGRTAEGRSWIDHRYRELVEQQDWQGLERYLLDEGWPPDAIKEALDHVKEVGLDDVDE